MRQRPSPLFVLPLISILTWDPSGSQSWEVGGRIKWLWCTHPSPTPAPFPQGGAQSLDGGLPGTEVTAMLIASYLRAFPANWFTGFWFPSAWRQRGKVNSPRQGLGLQESLLLLVGAPQTCSLHLQGDCCLVPMRGGAKGKRMGPSPL